VRYLLRKASVIFSCWLS